MLKLELLGGGTILVPYSSVKRLSFNGANVVLEYNDDLTPDSILVYITFEETGIAILNQQ